MVGDALRPLLNRLNYREQLIELQESYGLCLLYTLIYPNQVQCN